MTSNRERQRKYREKIGRERRINSVISAQAYQQLDRLAIYLGGTKRELLELMIEESERNTLKSISHSDVETEHYFNKIPPKW